NTSALIHELDRTFLTMTERRPGPALFEVPLDVLRADFPQQALPPLPALPLPLAPRPGEVQALADLITGWRKPLLLAGGGVLASGAESLLVQLAERLGAPIFHTLCGKSAVPSDHVLAAGLPWSCATSDLTNMSKFFSPLFAQADGMLAVGCRFTQAA